MPNVTVEELGWRFVEVCLKNYWGPCLFLILFLAGVLWTIFLHKKQEPRLFLCYTVFLLLTAYNPFLVNYLIPKLGFENEYYRFFWILPVAIGVAYYAVRIIFLSKKKVIRVFAFILAAALIVACGSPLTGAMQELKLPQNIYKVPDDLIFACNVIHEDSDSENPRVVFDMNLNMLARQYDASLYLVLHRDAVIYRAGSTVAGTINEDNKYYKRQKCIMDVTYYALDMPVKLFRAALYLTGTEYLVFPVGLPKSEFIQAAGCEPIAENGSYVIYRFNREKSENTQQ